MALETIKRSGSAKELLTAGLPAKGDYRCSECGYGIVAFRTLPECPMCRGRSWIPTGWSPFAGRRPETG